MDWKIFSLYLHEQKKENKHLRFFDAFKHLPLKDKIIVILSFSTAFLIFITRGIQIFSSELPTVMNILIYIALIILFILSIIPDSISNSKELIETSKEQRHALMQFLESENITKKNQIKQLHQRLENRLKQQNGNKEKFEKNILLTCQILLIPIALLIMSEILDSGHDTDTKAFLCFLTLFVPFIFSMVFIPCYKSISMITSIRYMELKSFLSLLQDILDFEYEIEDSDIIS